MKHILILMIVIGMAFVPFFSFGNSQDVYAKSGKIVELDYENDVVTCKDCVGYVWEFYGVEDWHVGDWCAMVLKTMGTQSILDDEIISVRYECWE